MNKARLLAECARLTASMEYDEKRGFYFWPSAIGPALSEYERHCGICTHGARLLAEKFRGFVAGYETGPDDPLTLVGARAGGHDFAVVAEWIVDWWGWEYDQALDSPVLSRADGIALGKYKPKQAWELCPDYDFRRR